MSLLALPFSTAIIALGVAVEGVPHPACWLEATAVTTLRRCVLPRYWVLSD